MHDWPSLQPILADDAIVAIVVAVFSIIGWLIKVAANANEQSKKPAPRAKLDRPKKIEEEISVFLDEVGGRPGDRGTTRPSQNRPAPSRSSRGNPQPQPKAARVDPKRKPSPPARGSSQPPRPAPKAEITPRRTSAPGEELSHRGSPASPGFGDQVQQHLQTFMADRIGKQVSADIAPTISQSVTQHLGQATATTDTAAIVQHVPAHPLVQLLRDPKSMRQSLIVSMVLAPAPALAKLKK